MKALLLNTLIGIGLGRFTTIWSALLFIPIVAAEVAYDVLAFHLSFDACLRRWATLLVTAELAFLLGALLRPMRAESEHSMEADPDKQRSYLRSFGRVRLSEA